VQPGPPSDRSLHQDRAQQRGNPAARLGHALPGPAAGAGRAHQPRPSVSPGPERRDDPRATPAQARPRTASLVFPTTSVSAPARVADNFPNYSSDGSSTRSSGHRRARSPPLYESSTPPPPGGTLPGTPDLGPGSDSATPSPCRRGGTGPRRRP
jgi:hypothetical protein